MELDCLILFIGCEEDNKIEYEIFVKDRLKDLSVWNYVFYFW